MSAVLKTETRIISTDKARVAEWVCSRIGVTLADKNYEAIGLEKNGELVAGFMYDNYNGRSIAMHVAAEGTGWLKHETEFLNVCFDYPYNQLGVKKVISTVDSLNVASWKFAQYMGGEIEVVIKDAGLTGDMVILSMSREQCRFLGDYSGQKFVATKST